jgi:ATP-binding cassette subfamily C protein LapB
MQQTVSTFPKINARAPELIVSSLLINLMSLAVPLTMMQIYDRILVNNATSSLAWLITGSVVAIALDCLLRLARSYVTSWIAARFEYTAGRWIMSHLFQSFFKPGTQERITNNIERINAVGVLRGYYTGQVFQTLLDMPFVVLFVAAMYTISAPLGNAVLAISSIYFFIVFLLRSFFEASRKNHGSSSSSRLEIMMEVLERIHIVKALGFEEQVLRRYEKSHAENSEAILRNHFWLHLPANIGLFFSQASLFIVVGIGAHLAIKGELTLGGLSAATLLTGRILQPVQNMGAFFYRISEAKVAKQKLIPLNNQEIIENTTHPEIPVDIDGRIEVRDATLKISPEKTLFQKSQLTLQPGQIAVVNAKKYPDAKHFLWFLKGLIPPEEGKIWIDSYDLHAFNSSRLRGRIEYVPENGLLFRGTVLENISLFEEHLEVAALETASMLGLDSWAADLPYGYETTLDTQANFLHPRGVLQRIALARCLVTCPKILLVDRICAGLDQESLDIFRSMLSRLKGKTTTVVLTGDPKILTTFDTHIEFVDNKLTVIKGGST